jgi:hypothetical protein
MSDECLKRCGVQAGLGAFDPSGSDASPFDRQQKPKGKSKASPRAASTFGDPLDPRARQFGAFSRAPGRQRLDICAYLCALESRYGNVRPPVAPAAAPAAPAPVLPAAPVARAPALPAVPRVAPPPPAVLQPRMPQALTPARPSPAPYVPPTFPGVRALPAPVGAPAYPMLPGALPPRAVLPGSAQSDEGGAWSVVKSVGTGAAAVAAVATPLILGFFAVRGIARRVSAPSVDSKSSEYHLGERLHQVVQAHEQIERQLSRRPLYRNWFSGMSPERRGNIAFGVAVAWEKVAAYYPDTKVVRTEERGKPVIRITKDGDPDPIIVVLEKPSPYEVRKTVKVFREIRQEVEGLVSIDGLTVPGTNDDVQREKKLAELKLHLTVEQFIKTKAERKRDEARRTPEDQQLFARAGKLTVPYQVVAMRIGQLVGPVVVHDLTLIPADEPAQASIARTHFAPDVPEASARPAPVQLAAGIVLSPEPAWVDLLNSPAPRSLPAGAPGFPGAMPNVMPPPGVVPNAPPPAPLPPAPGAGSAMPPLPPAAPMMPPALPPAADPSPPPAPLPDLGFNGAPLPRLLPTVAEIVPLLTEELNRRGINIAATKPGQEPKDRDVETQKVAITLRRMLEHYPSVADACLEPDGAIKPGMFTELFQLGLKGEEHKKISKLYALYKHDLAQRRLSPQAASPATAEANAGPAPEDAATLRALEKIKALVDAEFARKDWNFSQRDREKLPRSILDILEKNPRVAAACLEGGTVKEGMVAELMQLHVPSSAEQRKSALFGILYPGRVPPPPPPQKPKAPVAAMPPAAPAASAAPAAPASGTFDAFDAPAAAPAPVTDVGHRLPGVRTLQERLGIPTKPSFPPLPDDPASTPPAADPAAPAPAASPAPFFPPSAPGTPGLDPVDRSVVALRDALSKPIPMLQDRGDSFWGLPPAPGRTPANEPSRASVMVQNPAEVQPVRDALAKDPEFGLAKQVDREELAEFILRHRDTRPLWEERGLGDAQMRTLLQSQLTFITTRRVRAELTAALGAVDQFKVSLPAVQARLVEVLLASPFQRRFDHEGLSAPLQSYVIDVIGGWERSQHTMVGKTVAGTRNPLKFEEKPDLRREISDPVDIGRLVKGPKPK